jgi:hypothetical protein
MDVWANPESTTTQNNNHRTYSTIQFQKTAGAFFILPAILVFWCGLICCLLSIHQKTNGLALLLLPPTGTDQWARTFLVILNYNGYVHLIHVPLQGQKSWLYQRLPCPFLQQQWVFIKVYLDTRPSKGYAKVWQNGTLVSFANIAYGNHLLSLAHFRLFADPSASTSTIYTMMTSKLKRLRGGITERMFIFCFWGKPMQRKPANL